MAQSILSLTLRFIYDAGRLNSQENRRQQEELTESVFKGYKRRKAQFEYRLKRLHEQVLR